MPNDPAQHEEHGNPLRLKALEDQIRCGTQGQVREGISRRQRRMPAAILLTLALLTRESTRLFISTRGSTCTRITRAPHYYCDRDKTAEKVGSPTALLGALAWEYTFVPDLRRAVR